MTRKLVRNVQVDGVWYRPGDTPPADVAERITNPKAWAGDEPAPALERQEQAVKQPPRKGPGSGGPAWTEFAASKGITKTFDSKEALIRHLEDEGLIDKE